jgi:uncharacterized membrane protein YqaE (UPF0057 family)
MPYINFFCHNIYIQTMKPIYLIMYAIIPPAGVTIIVGSNFGFNLLTTLLLLAACCLRGHVLHKRMLDICRKLSEDLYNLISENESEVISIDSNSYEVLKFLTDYECNTPYLHRDKNGILWCSGKQLRKKD